ncbi:MAG: M56 family metallopeptidase [Actinomycetales bacterium]|nr:M56 family metallopeptidase [Actinomycetales bacterium]
MLLAAGALAALALALAGPVPVLLARARWTTRAPATALVLWQAVALAGVLAILGAPLLAGLAPLGASAPAALGALAQGLRAGRLELPPSSVLALTATAALAGYLAAHVASTGIRIAAQRRRHHALLTVLSTPDPARRDTRLLDERAPLAYCLPRGLGSVTVLSRGLVDALAPDELDAVVAHEGAHVAQRHDLVLTAFRAWRAALLGFPIAALAEARVAALVEMVADDQAARRAGADALARAVDRVGVRVAETGVTSALVAERSGRLRAPRPLPRLARTGLVLAAAGLLAGPAVALALPAFA